MTGARIIQLPQERITVWVYSPRAFDVKIRHQQVKHFRDGRPIRADDAPWLDIVQTGRVRKVSDISAD